MTRPVSSPRRALQDRARLYGGLAFGLQLVAGFAIGFATVPSSVPTAANWAAAVGVLLGLAAQAAWIVGLAALGRSKGYSRWMGLLGLLTLVGLVVMLALPNAWAEPPPRGDPRGDYPRPHG